MSSSRRPSPSLYTNTQFATPSSTLPDSTSTPTNFTAIIVTVVVVLLLSCVAIAGYIIYRRRTPRRQSLNGYQRHYRAELDNRPPTTSRPTKRPGAVDTNHAAARITPYGSSTNLVPRYNHSPGNDMRIATRRPDGAWEFSNPGSPFNPVGVDELEPPASASPLSTFKVPATPTTPTKSSTASTQGPLPPTPETPSFPPGLSQSIPLLPSDPPSTPTTPRNVITFSASSSSTTSASHSTTTIMEPPKSPAQIMKECESRAARLIRQGYDDREFSDEPPPPAYGYDPCYLDHAKEPSDC